VAVVVTDLVSISRIWADKRYEYILCPTQDAADRLEMFGISKEKLRVIGFPIRKRFNDASQNSEPPASTMPPEGRSHFLIVATSFGTRYAKRMVSLLLDMCDCTITILTGRDEKLKNALLQHFKSHILDRVSLPGYVNDVEKYLRGSDLLITRAGPNILMEAVSCQIPIVVTSYLPGQEEGNPAWIARQGLGVTCLDVNRLPQVVDSLLANDRFMMKKIRKAQQNYSAPRATYETALFLSKMANNR
jgi:UDP-N-acetylglucosamine:LPS N-acetylglucosamine transferase